MSRAQMLRKAAELRRQHRRPAWKTAVWSVVGSLLVASVGAGSALLGARAGAHASIETARMQLAEQRAKEDRDRRSKVYADYLSAAVAFSLATHRVFDRWAEQAKAANGKKFVPDKAVLTSYYAARSAYQNQVNQLSIYGSDAAWAAHRKLAAVLPPAIESYDVEPVDSDQFLAAYRGFLDVFCMEVPANPRKGCTEP